MDIQEKQKYKQKFIEKYLEYKERIVQKEPLRRWWCFLRTFSLILANVIALFIGAVLLYLCIISSSNNNSAQSFFEYIMTYICVFAGIVAIYVGILHFFDKFNLKKKFSRMIKGICFSGLMGTFDFIKNGYDPEYSVTLSGLISNSISGDTKIMIDDRFYGCYKDVSFHITELSNGMIRGKKGAYRGPWCGIVLSFKCNKYANSRIDLIPVSDINAYVPCIAVCILLCFFCLLGLQTNLGSLLFLFLVVFIFALMLVFGLYYSRYKKVNLEDIFVGKKFYVQSENQVEARYILTPAFIEKLNNLGKLFKAKRMWCSFEGYRMTMAFETKHDLFEIGNLYKSVNDPKQVEQFFNEVMAITDIIDHFKLNERTSL